MSTPPDPVAVILAMHDLCNAGDLDRVIALFSDDAVVRNLPPPDPPETGIYTGKHEIRAWFAPQIQHHLHVISQNYQAAGDTVTWDTIISEDTLRSAGIESFRVNAAATVKNGKIASFSITPIPESLRRFGVFLGR